MRLLIRFEHYPHQITGPVYGPFSFAQLTYNTLRVGNEAGEDSTLAVFTNEQWRVQVDPEGFAYADPPAYTDVIVYPASN